MIASIIEGNGAFAKYNFEELDASTEYVLAVKYYTGNAGESLVNNNN